MNLTPVEIDAIHVGQPLPFSLLSENGTLLAIKGYVIKQREELDTLTLQRSKLYIDITESESHRRAYMSKLNSMVLDDKELGKIAQTGIAPIVPNEARDKVLTNSTGWLDLQDEAHLILRDTKSSGFLHRLIKLKNELDRQLKQNPDGTLFALNHLASTEIMRYSATHSMLVGVVCALAARDVLKWPQQHIDSLFFAALSMNIGMTELHDRLTIQKESPSADQLRVIEVHAAMSRDILVGFGVSDSNWLEAVLHHRTKLPGPLNKHGEGDRMARLIQRADMFAAKISPRASRVPDSQASAMQSCYFDENRQLDEAGAALLKAVGIYSPGTFVKLKSNEIAIVVKRGRNTTMPRVAVLVNRQGMPTGEPIMRETSLAEFRIVASVPIRDVKVSHNLERLLHLTKTQTSDRPW